MAVNLPSYKKVSGVQISKKLSGGDSVRVIYAFNYAVLYELIKLLHTAFMAKAAGGADMFGNSWIPLSQKTYNWKLNSHKRTAVTIGGIPAINIRTRELERSLRPGQYVAGKYVPSPHQKIEVTTKRISLSITVAHAGKVQAVRPFFPDELSPFVEQAILKAVPRLNRYLKEIGFN